MGSEGGTLVVEEFGTEFVELVDVELLDLAFRSVCLGEGRMSIRSVSPFFFLALA